MADEFILGMNGKLYYGESGDALLDMTEVDNVRDLTLTLEAGEADVTTRANLGWKATVATLRECSLEFEMMWKPSDGAFAAIQAAFLGSTVIALAALTGESDVAGSEGIRGDFAITSFSRSEPLTEGMTVKVSAKLAKYEDWEVVAGS